jgi:two-component sensor histidine kinase
LVRGERWTQRDALTYLTRLNIPFKKFVAILFSLVVATIVIGLISQDNFFCVLLAATAIAGVGSSFYLLLRADVANQRVSSLIEERNAVAKALAGAMQMVSDRDVLISETSHRVRNDLTTLASMVRLQKNKLGLARGAEVLAAVEFRLGVLVKVHQRLKSVGGETSVDSAAFLGDLIHDLKASLIGFRPVQVITNIESHNLPHKSAVALGLIMNEALVNSTKYAFEEDEEGTVLISFKRVDDAYKLAVIDDGIGNDGTIRGTGLGSKLMTAMAQQLNGVLTTTSENGTRIEVVFPRV